MSWICKLLVARRGVRHACQVLLPWLLLPRALSSAPRISRDLQENYRVLGLSESDISPAQVKEAYLRLAKRYHPDSRAGTADPVMFARVEEAYRAVLAHVGRTQAQHPAGQQEEEELRGVAPQHRHYLSYEGRGSGTPSQRQRQYQQYRVDRAAEQVLDYRQREHERAAAAEGALVERDVRQRSRKAKVTQAVERLVEDLIQEAMARGDFRNLSGAGKPLSKFQDNPYADPMTHNLNRILIDNGYQPAWVLMQRDIREGTAHIRHRLLEGRALLSDHMTLTERAQWEQLCRSVGEELVQLNKMVDRLNLTVPALRMQMVHFSLAREVERAERGAQQLRQNRQQDRQQRKEEKRKANATQRPKLSRTGLLAWMQSLLR